MVLFLAAGLPRFEKVAGAVLAAVVHNDDLAGDFRGADTLDDALQGFDLVVNGNHDREPKAGGNAIDAEPAAEVGAEHPLEQFDPVDPQRRLFRVRGNARFQQGLADAAEVGWREFACERRIGHSSIVPQTQVDSKVCAWLGGVSCNEERAGRRGCADERRVWNPRQDKLAACPTSGDASALTSGFRKTLNKVK